MKFELDVYHVKEHEYTMDVERAAQLRQQRKDIQDELKSLRNVRAAAKLARRAELESAEAELGTLLNGAPPLPMHPAYYLEQILEQMVKLCQNYEKAKREFSETIVKSPTYTMQRYADDIVHKEYIASRVEIILRMWIEENDGDNKIPFLGMCSLYDVCLEVYAVEMNKIIGGYEEFERGFEKQIAKARREFVTSSWDGVRAWLWMLDRGIEAAKVYQVSEPEKPESEKILLKELDAQVQKAHEILGHE